MEIQYEEIKTSKTFSNSGQWDRFHMETNQANEVPQTISTKQNLIYSFKNEWECLGVHKAEHTLSHIL